MNRAVIINKSFSKADVKCYKNEITCYSGTGVEGISKAEYIGYVIDTVKGRGRCSGGKCTFEDVNVTMRIGGIKGPDEELRV